jgi:hypothetical protein
MLAFSITFLVVVMDTALVSAIIGRASLLSFSTTESAVGVPKTSLVYLPAMMVVRGDGARHDS